MEQQITVTLTTKQAIAILAASLELGLDRYKTRPELVKAETTIASALAYASISSQDALQAARSQEPPLCP